MVHVITETGNSSKEPEHLRNLHRVYLRPSKNKDRDELTNFAICGDYACWRASNAQEVSVINIKQVIEQSKLEGGRFFQFKENTIDLSDFVDKEKILMKQRQAITIEACNPLFALHAFSEEKLSEKQIIQRSNAIQVSVGSRGIVYDLNPVEHGKDPLAISEIPAMHHLLKVQGYVETGYIIQNMSSHKAQSKVVYQLTKSIKSNFEGSLYYLSREQQLLEKKKKPKEQDANG